MTKVTPRLLPRCENRTLTPFSLTPFSHPVFPPLSHPVFPRDGRDLLEGDARRVGLGGRAAADGGFEFGTDADAEEVLEELAGLDRGAFVQEFGEQAGPPSSIRLHEALGSPSG